MTGPQGMGPLIGTVGTAYDIDLSTLGTIWKSNLQPFGAPEWLTYADALSEDVVVEINGYGGNYYFHAWWLESGYAPATYQDALDGMGVIWQSDVNVLSTTVDAPAMGGTITTPGDGYRYHTFNTDAEFWTGKVTGNLVVDLAAVGGGGCGGRGGPGANGGGGGGGKLNTTSGTIAEGVLVTIGIGGAQTGGRNTPGAPGTDTTIGAMLTGNGGSGGGAPGTAGPSTTGGGGGGGYSAFSGPVSGGAGNDGAGDGATGNAGPGNTPSGGGGGSGGNAPGTNGGDGEEWPPGSGDYYGGGGSGGNASGGTYTGGSGVGGNYTGGALSTPTPNRGGGSAGGTNDDFKKAADGRAIIRYAYP